MEVFHIDSLSEREFELILAVLDAGGVVGFPTDTSYGLAADPYNPAAIARLFEIKGRPEIKPVLALVDSMEMAERLAVPPAGFRDLAQRYWPGPLTVIMRAAHDVPDVLTAGTHTVGVRWPKAALALELIRRFGRPVTATSANRSGMPSCVTADEVAAQLGDRLEFLIDGDRLPERGGSTLLDLTAVPPVLLREGPISFEMLSTFFNGQLRRPAS